jgi:hypothetical protein
MRSFFSEFYLNAQLTLLLNKNFKFSDSFHNVAKALDPRENQWYSVITYKTYI